MKNAVTFIFTHFTLVMLGLSVLIAFAKSGNFFNRLTHAMLFFAVGLSGLWGFIGHAFFPISTSAFIGWVSSPFEFEVAIANLALGVMGIFSVICSSGYKKATATYCLIFGFGAAFGHIREIIISHNFHPGNSGAILYTDIAIPIILWIALLNRRQQSPRLEHI